MDMSRKLHKITLSSSHSDKELLQDVAKIEAIVEHLGRKIR